MIGLANDSRNSYVVFYKDYFTMEDEGNYTINSALCQNLDVSETDELFFIVLKCNSFNVYSVGYLIVPKNKDKFKEPLVSLVVQDEVINVAIGRSGKRSFVVAANLVTGLVLNRVDIDVEDMSMTYRMTQLKTMPTVRFIEFV